MTTKAPKFAPITGEAALSMRQKTGLNQSRFWSVVGVVQSAGSRYESGRDIPEPVQMLYLIRYGTAKQSQAMIEKLTAGAK